MKNIPVILRKRPARAHSNSDPPRVKSPAGRVVLGLPVRKVPVVSAEQEVYVSPYQDPAKVLEHKQFIGFGCGACQHHRLKLDRRGYHCAASVKLWPEGTDKTCAAFMRRVKQPGRSKQEEGR
jgi:hypothetical protein